MRLLWNRIDIALIVCYKKQAANMILVRRSAHSALSAGNVPSGLA
jgi:hypothetical protein